MGALNRGTWPRIGGGSRGIASSVCQAYRAEDKQQHFECEIGLPIAAPNPRACMHHAGHCPVKELRLLFTAAADAMMDLRRSHGNRRVADGMVVMATANRREAFKKGVAATASRTYIYLHLHLHLLYHHHPPGKIYYPDGATCCTDTGSCSVRTFYSHALAHVMQSSLTGSLAPLSHSPAPVGSRQKSIDRSSGRRVKERKGKRQKAVHRRCIPKDTPPAACLACLFLSYNGTAFARSNPVQRFHPSNNHRIDKVLTTGFATGHIWLGLVLVAGWRSKISARRQTIPALVARVSLDSLPSNPHRIPDALGFLCVSRTARGPGRRSTRACSKDRKFALVLGSKPEAIHLCSSSLPIILAFPITAPVSPRFCSSFSISFIPPLCHGSTHFLPPLLTISPPRKRHKRAI
ncbi:hypothetical protein HDV62DRAFT_384737 [Trichoderma sp. SZMC 28011]